ncbi:uroporphyrinogen-III C-methyltransferase [Salinisphaera sp. T31B1]|uniref:uroporphyrinogen-III C-methyltransferase n=1 Tax=Salinisphaera sp. T31B1 TaxID=727963 RepID=UPI00333F4622
MSEDKRNDAQADKGAGNEAGKHSASKPSSTGQTTGSNQGGGSASAPAAKPDSSKTQSKAAAAAPSNARADGSTPADGSKKATSESSRAADKTGGSAASATASKKQPQRGSKPAAAAAASDASSSARDGKTVSASKPSATATAATGGGSAHAQTGHRGERTDDAGRKSLLVAIIALIIAVVALIGAGWLWFRGEQKLASLDSRVNTVEQGIQSSVQKVVMPRLSEVDKRMQSLSGDLDGLRQADQQQADQLATMKQSVQAAQTQTAELSDRIQGNARRWDLNQIESLLRAANQRLQLYNDPAGARQALQLASEAIARQGDPRLFKVRSEIVNEIAALRALPDPDIEGLSLDLAAMVKQVPSLALASTVPGEYRQGASGDTAADSSDNPQAGEGDDGMSFDEFKSQFTQGWGHFKNSVGQALSGMLTIRRADGTQSALLPPDQVFFLNQNLQLQLRTARLSLLEGDTDAYRDSLASARQWLGDYYDTDTSPVSSMRNRLDQMSNVKLDWQAPDISQSLAMLRERMSQPAGQAGGEQDGAQSASSDARSNAASPESSRDAGSDAQSQQPSGDAAGQDGR